MTLAITKILYMKDCGRGYPGKHLKQSIDYITVPEKCGDGRWVSAVNCQPGYAYEQMIKTKELFHKTDKRQGYHIIISFEEGEVTPDQAFQIVGEFVEEYLGRKGYEAVYAIHDNTAHVHGHIVFNSVNYLTGRKYRYEKGDWAKFMQPITNRLCEKYGLSTITIEDDTALEHDSYTEWRDRKDGRFVWSDMIRRDLDACIIQAGDFDDFLKLLSDKGYDIKQNKYLAVKPPGMGRYRRCRYFGADYTEERIRERIITEDLEYYRSRHKEARILKVAVPYHIRRAKLSGIQRKYFSRLYRIGKLKQRPYSQAWKYREEIRKMHRLHDEYMFLSDYEIHSADDLLRVKSEIGQKRSAVEKERRKIYKKQAGFRGLWGKVERIHTLSFAERAYKEGDVFFEDEHKEYEQLTDEIKKEGYSVGELESLKDGYKEKSKRLGEEYSSLNKAYRIAERLMNEQEDEDIGRADREEPVRKQSGR